MSFASIEFLLFAAVFFIAWPVARVRSKTRWVFLTFTSLFFYGWCDWRFAFLLIFTGLTDYSMALLIKDFPGKRRLFLGLSIGTNLGVLLFFKYAYFVLGQVALLFGWPGNATLGVFSMVALPVGLSFYTFQSMSYTIDVYKGRLNPAGNVFHFFSFICLFPQLVAGPIVRAVDLLPQLETPGDYSAANRWFGLERVALGYFKKLVIADNLAPYVNDVFGRVNPGAGLGAIWWVAATFFALQIYFDFSGYSDIACGLARWMGYGFLENFRSPYVSLGFRDFWSRWHISLSTWFRDYLYLPLGGSRKGNVRNILNLWVTMLVSGLWHGANWTFLAWAAAHSLYLTIERVTKWPERISGVMVGRLFGVAVTFALTVIAWIFFRAESIVQAVVIICAMLTCPFSGIDLACDYLDAGHLLGIAGTAILGVLALIGRRWSGIQSLPVLCVRGVSVVACLVACVFLRGNGQAFIYFRF